MSGHNHPRFAMDAEGVRRRIMLKRIALALTFVAALGVAGLGANRSAEAYGGCHGHGGGHGYGAYYPGYYSSWGYAPRYTYYGGYPANVHYYRGVPHHHHHRSNGGVYFSIGF